MKSLLYFIILALSFVKAQEENPVLFVNVVVKDASGAVGKKIGDKVPKFLPNVFSRKISEAAGDVAAKKVKPSTVAAKMSAKMSKKLPEKMKSKGLTVNVKEDFREGPYFVLKVAVQNVDTATLAETKAKKGAFVTRIWNILGEKKRKQIESEILPKIVARKMSVAMGEMLREKFIEKKMIAEIKTLYSDKKQDDYFKSTINRIRGGATSYVEEEEEGINEDATTDEDKGHELDEVLSDTKAAKGGSTKGSTKRGPKGVKSKKDNSKEL